MWNFFRQKKEPATEPVVEEKGPDYKELFKSLKKEFESYKKSVDLEKKSEKEQLKADQKVLKELSEKKKELFETTNLLKQEKEKALDFEKKWEEEKKKNMSQKEEIEDLNFEKSKLAESINRISNIKNSSVGQQKHIQNNFKALHDRFEEQKKKLKRQEATILQKNERIKDLEKTVDQFITMRPSVILEHLMNRLTRNTFDQFDSLIDLQKKYKRVRGILNLDKRNKGRIEEEPEFGYLMKDLHHSNKYRFVNTEDVSYEVVDFNESGRKIGCPVSAIVHPKKGIAQIVWFYDTDDEMLVEKETVNQKKKQKQAQEEKDYHFIGPVNVLLVTNKHGIKYRERLRKHGVNAEWMDPYEKSFVHIRNRSNSYDVVLLLEDAMPHEARQLIDEFKKIPDKVQTMWEAKADDVVARVRYVALKKGLLSNGVKLA